MTDDSNIKRYAVTFGPTDKLIEHPGGLWMRFDDAQREIDAAYNRGFAEGSGNEGEYQREITQHKRNLAWQSKEIDAQVQKIQRLNRDLRNARESIGGMTQAIERMQGVIATREEALRALTRELPPLAGRENAQLINDNGAKEIERLRAKLHSIRARCLNLAQWIDKGCDPKHGATEASFIALFAKEPSSEPSEQPRPAAWMRRAVSAGGPWGPPEIDYECYAGDDPPEDGNKDWIPLYRHPEAGDRTACAYIGAPQGEPKPCVLSAGHPPPHVHVEPSEQLSASEAASFDKTLARSPRRIDPTPWNPTTSSDVPIQDQPQKPREWHFDRYRGGQLMAEGVVVRKKATFEEALEWARCQYPPFTDVFKLRDAEKSNEILGAHRRCLICGKPRGEHDEKQLAECEAAL